MRQSVAQIDPNGTREVTVYLPNTEGKLTLSQQQVIEKKETPAGVTETTTSPIRLTRRSWQAGPRAKAKRPYVPDRAEERLSRDRSTSASPIPNAPAIKCAKHCAPYRKRSRSVFFVVMPSDHRREQGEQERASPGEIRAIFGISFYPFRSREYPPSRECSAVRRQPGTSIHSRTRDPRHPAGCIRARR